MVIIMWVKMTCLDNFTHQEEKGIRAHKHTDRQFDKHRQAQSLNKTPKCKARKEKPPLQRSRNCKELELARFQERGKKIRLKKK